MSNPHHELFQFVLEKAEQEPNSRKIRLYRALASYAGNPEEASKLNTLADGLESADHLCREFIFNFRGDS
jgi:hypothetical protein